MRDSHEAIRANDDINVAGLVGNISGYDRLTLAKEWRTLFGTAPAKNISSAILIRIIAHEHQCRTYGGLNVGSKRALRKELGSSYHKQSSNTVSDLTKLNSKRDRPITTSRSQTSLQSINPSLLAAGTQLVREWNGRPYRVEVIESGFVLDGKSYSSLSAIAKKITGTHWSGPRFFGLNKVGNQSRKAAQ